MLFVECTDYASACINAVDALQRESDLCILRGSFLITYHQDLYCSAIFDGLRLSLEYYGNDPLQLPLGEGEGDFSSPFRAR